MRIVHVLAGRCNPESTGGTEKTVYFLSRAQAALGHQVGIWGFSRKDPIPVPGVEVHTIRPGCIPLTVPHELVGDLLAFRPDIVHLHFVFSPPCTALGWALRRNGIPYVVTPHGFLSRGALGQRPLRKAVYGRIFERAHLNAAVAVHATCERERVDCLRYGVAAPIFVAPNGFDVASLPIPANPNALIDLIPSAKGKRTFLFVGRLAWRQKGLDLLIEGVRQAAPYLRGTITVLIGPSWRGQKETLEAEVAAAGLDELVAFSGPVFGQQKADVLAGADVFVHTSRWEGIPFSVLEAMASSRPCLVTEATNLGEVIRRHRAGIVVAPAPEAIAAELRALARLDLGELRDMGERAQQAIAVDFAWDSIARDVIAHYPASAEVKDSLG